jgi:hypothetical protein
MQSNAVFMAMLLFYNLHSVTLVNRNDRYPESPCSPF